MCETKITFVQNLPEVERPRYFHQPKPDFLFSDIKKAFQLCCGMNYFSLRKFSECLLCYKKEGLVQFNSHLFELKAFKTPKMKFIFLTISIPISYKRYKTILRRISTEFDHKIDFQNHLFV